MKKAITVEEFIQNVKQGKDILLKLRALILSVGLEETIKWGIPVYTTEGKNVVGIGSFKSYTGLWFYQGALLKDKSKALINAQKDRTKALRQMRFTSIEEVDDHLILDYLIEAIANQKQGKEIKPDRNKPILIPEELMEEFQTNKNLENCFNQFTAGKKREFTDYISEAKQKETRLKRVQKVIPLIVKNIGLNDKYRK